MKSEQGAHIGRHSVAPVALTRLAEKPLGKSRGGENGEMEKWEVGGGEKWGRTRYNKLI